MKLFFNRNALRSFAGVLPALWTRLCPSRSTRMMRLAQIAGLSLVVSAAYMVGGPILFNSAIAQERSFSSPKEPMIFTREISRQLADGKVINILRRWRIQFYPTETGYDVKGEQISIDVTVPPGLEALARLEKARGSNGAFVARLSREGLILSSEEQQQAQQVEAAVGAAFDYLAQRNPSAARRDDVFQFLQSIRSDVAKSMQELPEDFFFPKETEHSEQRLVSLPGGVEGEMRIDVQRSFFAEYGLLKKSERIITTQVGGNARVSREILLLEMASKVSDTHPKTMDDRDALEDQGTLGQEALEEQETLESQKRQSIETSVNEATSNDAASVVSDVEGAAVEGGTMEGAAMEGGSTEEDALDGRAETPPQEDTP